MIIIIDCDSCRTRFRLDVKAFKGFKAMRARCRKCGALIEVRNPVLSNTIQCKEAPPSNLHADRMNSPAGEEAAPCEKPVPLTVGGMDPVRNTNSVALPLFEPGPACMEKPEQNLEKLFVKTNSWREEGINGQPSLQQQAPQHRKPKTKSREYDYVRISNYVLVYAVLLFAGCGAYLLFRIFISYLN